MIASVSVMAHPKRAHLFAGLRKELGDVPFAVDHGRGLWDNFKAAWRLHDPTAKYHIVVQDDARLCRSFRARAQGFIKRVAAQRPYGFCFYYGRHRRYLARAKENKTGVIYLEEMRWGVAMAMPVCLIEDMIAFGERERPKKAVDALLGRFLASRGIRVAYPIPSLVDHHSEEPSLVGNASDIRRVAFRFIDGP